MEVQVFTADWRQIGADSPIFGANFWRFQKLAKLAPKIGVNWRIQIGESENYERIFNRRQFGESAPIMHQVQPAESVPNLSYSSDNHRTIGELVNLRCKWGAIRTRW